MATRTPTLYTGTWTGQTGQLNTALKSALVTGEGWAILYESGNTLVLQQAAGSGFVLRIVDDGSLAAGAREATVRPAEGATDVNTLVDPFPTVAQRSDATCIWRKSDTADGTARNYRITADDRYFVLEVQFGTTSWDVYIFGDAAPFWSGDNYCCVFNHRETANNGAAANAILRSVQSPTIGAGSPQWYFARTPDGLTKVDYGALVAIASNSFGNTGGLTCNYPANGSTQINMRRAQVSSMGNSSVSMGTSGGPRCHLPFFFEPMHGLTWSGATPGDTFTHTAYDPSSLFRIRHADSATSFNNTQRRWIIQEAGTWTGGSL